MWWAVAIIAVVGALNLAGTWILLRDFARTHRALVLVARFTVSRVPGPVPVEVEELIGTYVGGSRRART